MKMTTDNKDGTDGVGVRVTDDKDELTGWGAEDLY